MTINIKNFLKDKTKLSKMGEFQNLKQIDGLEMSSISADLYGDGRDDLALLAAEIIEREKPCPSPINPF